MPFLQSSGAISIADLNSFFPGSGTSMSNFYRGGGRVPSTKTVTTREPSSGSLYDGGNQWYWRSYDSVTVVVFGGGVQGTLGQSSGSITSLTFGSWTYYRDSFVGDDGNKNGPTYYYRIFRQQSTTTSINAAIPSSGAISLSQFYGAETP